MAEDRLVEVEGVGTVTLRVLTQGEVLNLWRAVATIDLAAALEVFDGDPFGLDAEGWGLEDMRAFIEVYALVSMAVISPVRERFERGELPEVFPGGLIKPDEVWTDAVLQRLDLKVLELAGMAEHDVENSGSPIEGNIA